MLKRQKKILGLEMLPMSQELIRDYQLPDDVKGIVIVDVDRRSEAAEKGVAEGDIVVELRFKNDVLNPTTVQQIEDFVAKVRSITPDPKEISEDDDKPENKILFQINRRATTRYIALKATETPSAEDENFGEEDSEKKGSGSHTKNRLERRGKSIG